jgi:hypothetical protein
MALFTSAEARAFDKGQLADATAYPDGAITAKAAGIAARFRRICGVAFETVSETVTLDGVRGSGPLILPRAEVTAVTAAATRDGATWTNLTVDQLAALTLDGWRVDWPGGYWPYRERSVRLTITHGFATVPDEIRRAGLIVAINELVPTNISERTLSFSNQDGQTYRYATPGMNRHSWYGLPWVDEVLEEYRDRYVLPGVG